MPLDIASSHTRKGEIKGFLVSGTNLSIERCTNYLNFIQEIWLLDAKDQVHNHKHSWLITREYENKKLTCAVPFMACAEILSQTKKIINEQDIIDLVEVLSSNKNKSKLKSPSTGITSTQHVHALHKYKAKFFPRLIRSFMVEYFSLLPKNKEGKIAFLDPFVGSGTSVIEASLLGMESYGIDIDSLSCEISAVKIAAINLNVSELEKNYEYLKKIYEQKSLKLAGYAKYNLPKDIVKKFERKNNLAEKNEYEENITAWQNAIAQVNNKEIRRFFAISLSDALTRKFVIRMMGTGVGRFALEIAKTPLDKLVKSNIESSIRSVAYIKALMNAYNIEIANSKIIKGTAVELPFCDNEFSLILTSPPYLPASSGREDYLVGKAISNTALGIMTNEEIEEAEKLSVGSMKWEESDTDNLPTAVISLYNWLLQDELRNIKAKPTLAYYISLNEALNENFRTLLPGGIAIYVIGKESVFYKFSTREVLYRVSCDEIFQELALSNGFQILERIDVELDKKNKNARPRSLDSYYETVFILQKPQNI